MSAAKIRALNDAFRTTMSGGRVMMTAGVDALPSDVKAMVIRKVATFSEFRDWSARMAQRTRARLTLPISPACRT